MRRMFFIGWNAFHTQHFCLTSETKIGDFIQCMVLTKFFQILFLLWTWTLTLRKKIFSSRRCYVLKRMLLGFNFAIYGFDVMWFLIISLEYFMFSRKAFSWIKTGDNFLLQSCVDDINEHRIKLTNNIALKAPDFCLFSHWCSTFNEHEGCAHYTKNMLAFQLDVLPISAATFATNQLSGPRLKKRFILPTHC